MNNIKFLLLAFLAFSSCTTQRNFVGSQEGWITSKDYEHKDNSGFDYLVLALHYAEDTSKVVTPSVYTINGVKFVTTESSLSLLVLPGNYEIKAWSLSLKTVEKKIVKKPFCSTYVDFYLRDETFIIKEKKISNALTPKHRSDFLGQSCKD